jgi:hypothetical protein
VSEEYPERPDHPDLRLLFQAVQDLDNQADAGQDITDMIARYINPDSAIYVARERSERAMVLGGEFNVALLGTAWMDGLVTGMMVQFLKNRPSPPDGQELS